jgi:hypothetical protein
VLAKHFGGRRFLPRGAFLVGAFSCDIDLMNVGNVTGSKQQYAKCFELPKERDHCSDGPARRLARA